MQIRFIVFVAAIAFSFPIYAQYNVKEITIIHWNDFHAYNQIHKGTKKNSGTEDIYYFGGTGSMLGWVNRLRNDHSLVLNAGDDFQGTPISNFTRGKSQIELLNLYGLDAFTIGNHEFDYTDASLDSALLLAKFNYLSANVWLKSKNRLIGKPYVIKEVNGVKVGIIGITAPDLTELELPENLTDIVMLNTDSVITVGTRELKNQKCNLIILLTHDGVDNDKKLAEKFYGDVDIIVGGHSHTPLFKPFIDSGVVIVQAGSYSRYIGFVDLKVDIEKDTLVRYFGRLYETNKDSAFDAEADAKVNAMVEAIGPELKRVIGKLEVDWKASYSDESNLGQFETDAFRWKTGADIALLNGGSLRKSLNKGDITLSDIWEINPFGNELVVMTVSGKLLIKMLNNNIAIKKANETEGKGSEKMLVSGLTFSFDMNRSNSNFVQDAKVDGKPVDESKKYTIAVNSYTFSQFKKFFGEVDGARKEYKATGLIDRDAVIDYIEKLKVVNQEVERRVTDLSKDK